jgi:hypothetical protein
MNNQNLRNRLQRLRNERNSRRAGGAGPVTNISELSLANLNRVIANIEAELAVSRTARRRRPRPYKRPRTHGERIAKKLANTTLLNNLLTRKPSLLTHSLLQMELHSRRRLKRKAPKKWPVRKSRIVHNMPNWRSNSANNIEERALGGATWNQVPYANAATEANLRRRLAANPPSPRTAATQIKQSQRYHRLFAKGAESGTEAKNARYKKGYSSGSSSRNSKTPSPSRSRNASPGSAVSTARKNNNKSN